MRPRKRFGQHFLEPAWVRKVVDAIAPGPGESFVEIGPGRGALTVPLASHAAAVVAVEIDRDLAAALPARVPPNVRVVVGDVLEVDLARILTEAAGAGTLRIAGNLPYNVSTPILFRVLDAAGRCPRLVDATLMLQKEVVDRLVAAPGTREYGVLSVLVGRRARIERLLALPPGAFRPPPEVTSAVVRLAFLPPDAIVPAPPFFDALVRAVFTRRRKTMSNALGAAVGERAATVASWLEDAAVDPRRRPETVTVAEFAQVARVLERRAGPSIHLMKSHQG